MMLDENKKQKQFNLSISSLGSPNILNSTFMFVESPIWKNKMIRANDDHQSIYTSENNIEIRRQLKQEQLKRVNDYIQNSSFIGESNSHMRQSKNKINSYSFNINQLSPNNLIKKREQIIHMP
jgi:hypothetical protein